MPAPAAQREVAEFLAGITGQGVVETHISLVFLGEREVLKLKKAVDLGFLDFTAPETRACLTAREQALNAPHAPGLYLGAVPVTRGPGGLALGGEGPAVDWVLRMRRLPETDFLDAHGPLEAPLLDALADAVVALHAAAPPRAGDGAMDATLAGNRSAGLAAGLPAEEVEAWHEAARAAHAALRPWLAERAAAGWLRRCHGDLHLGNLCLLEGRPHAFDALEFDEALATIDVGYDLAFLLMDLEQREGRAAANRVLNRYLGRTGDVTLLRGLPLWLSLRAFIRAHVAGRRGREAAPLLHAARGYLEARPAPRLVALGGLQGTGKSWMARRLAPWLGAAPGAAVLRSDEARKRLAGVPPETRLDAAAYAPAMNAAVFEALCEGARAALEAGHCVILDAMFQRAEERAALPALHPDFTGLWLTAPMEVLRARVAARQGDASDATLAILEAAAARDPGPLDWHILDTTHDAAGDAMKVLDLAAPPSP